MKTNLKRCVALAAFGLALAGAASVVWACSIPVFRYALERWQAEPYGVIVFHKGPLTPGQKKVVEWLNTQAQADAPYANIDVVAFDIVEDAKGPDGAEHPLMKIWQAEGAVDPPRMVLLYPRSFGIEEKVWSAPLSQAAAEKLVDSPTRRAIGKELIDGAPAVWLVLESADPKQNRAALKTLETEIKRLEELIELPPPIDAYYAMEPEGEEEGEGENQEPEEPKGEKVHFPIIRMARSTPAEEPFVHMLLGAEEGLSELKEPMAFPIFGRGRALFALVGKGINTENIEDACAFACGPCACQIKAMNPGADLLMLADWEGLLEEQPVTVADSIPLTTPQRVEPLPGTATVAEAAPAPTPEPAPAASPMLRNLLIVLGGGIVLVGIASCVLLVGRSSRSQ